MELQEEEIKDKSHQKIKHKNKNKENEISNKIDDKPKLKFKRNRKIITDSDEEEFEANQDNIKIIINNNKKLSTKEKIPITKYSSLSPDLFFDEFITDYKCISCGLIPSFETAEESICCGYLFCEQCKKKLEEKNNINNISNICPVCSIPTSKLKTRKIKQFNKIFYKSLKNFKIKCPYKCAWIGLWSDLESHLFKCESSFRYCIYKLVGCEFIDENKKVKEHEENNDKFHLDLALKFIKDKNIVKKKLKFELGEICMTSCHPHPLKYCINREASWICDGDTLELGCENVNNILSKDKPRYRCDFCNFDLCDSCIEKYFKNSFT